MIGLFGTCGGSKWRDEFMRRYTESGIPFYNPQVDNWTPECAIEEAEHLVNDEVILFPVTDETYGMGSLAETGFSIMSAIRANSNRFVAIYIAPDINEALKVANPQLAKESQRARALVRAHIKKQAPLNPNLFVVDSLAQLLDVSILLYSATEVLKLAKQRIVL